MAGHGAPLGNQYAAKAKIWSAAVTRAVEAWPEPPDSTDCSKLITGLNTLAHAFVKNCIEKGSVDFFREFGDRLEGKVPQSQWLSAPDNQPLPAIVQVTGVVPDQKPGGDDA